MRIFSLHEGGPAERAGIRLFFGGGDANPSEIKREDFTIW